MDPFTIFSQNIRGTNLSGTCRKKNIKMLKIKKLIDQRFTSKPNVICLQETYSMKSYCMFFRNPQYYWMHNQGSTHSGGTFTGIQLDFLKKYDSTTNHVQNIILKKGRISATKIYLKTKNNYFHIINVYIPHQIEINMIEDLECIKQYIVDLQISMENFSVFICGDFNFVTCPADANLTEGYEYRLPNVSSFWKQHIEKSLPLEETVFQKHTWFRKIFNGPMISEKLDRCYFYFEKPGPFLKYSVTVEETDYSDHSIVYVRFYNPKTQRNNDVKTKNIFQNIPHWVIRHPNFTRKILNLNECLSSHFGKKLTPGFVLNREIKKEFNYMSKEIINSDLQNDTLHWYNSSLINKCIQYLESNLFHLQKSWNSFRKRFNNDPLMKKIESSFGAGEKIQLLKGKLEELSEEREIELQRRREEIPNLQKKYRQKISRFIPNYRIGFVQLKFENQVLTTYEETMNRIIQFWGNKFKAPKKIKEEDLETFINRKDENGINFLFKELNDDCWEDPTEFEFSQAILKANHNKAPGPDGISSYVYKIDAKFYGNLFVNMYKELQIKNNPKISSNFNWCRFFLIPKKSGSAEIGECRPISVSNTDNRIITSAIVDRLQVVLKNILYKNQHGFRANHDITSNIELVSSRFYSQLHKNTQYLILFIDFEKAYDSINRDYLMFILRKLNLPEKFRNIIHNLYRNTKSYPIIPDSETEEEACFETFKGVKQGCPLSPLLFNIAIDPLLQWMDNILKRQPKSFISAYADDIAVGLENPQDLPKIFNRLIYFSRLSNLKVNPEKCGIMFTIMDNIPAINLSSFSQIPIVSNYKYLGFPIGPRVDLDDIYNPLIQKISKKIRDTTLFLKEKNSIWGDHQYGIGIKTADRIQISKRIFLPILYFSFRCYTPKEIHIKKILTLLVKFIAPCGGIKRTFLENSYNNGSFIPNFGHIRSRAITIAFSAGFKNKFKQKFLQIQNNKTFRSLHPMDVHFHWYKAFQKVLKLTGFEDFEEDFQNACFTGEKPDNKKIYSTISTEIQPKIDLNDFLKKKFEDAPKFLSDVFTTSELLETFKNHSILFWFKSLPLNSKVSLMRKDPGLNKCRNCDQVGESHHHHVSSKCRLVLEIKEKIEDIILRVQNPHNFWKYHGDGTYSCFPWTSNSTRISEIQGIFIYSLWLLITRFNDMTFEEKKKKIIALMNDLVEKYVIHGK